jgi:hypothetical protein
MIPTREKSFWKKGGTRRTSDTVHRAKSPIMYKVDYTGGPSGNLRSGDANEIRPFHLRHCGRQEGQNQALGGGKIRSC